MDVYSLAHRLAKAIKESEEYSGYSKTREEMQADKKAREMLQDFQKEQIRLQSRQLSGEEISEEDKEKFQNLREIVELNPRVKKYLEREYRVSILLNDLQKILFGDLELGMPEDEEKHPE